MDDGQVGKLDIPRLFDRDTLRSLGYWVEGLSVVDQLNIVRLVVLGVEHALSTTISLVQFLPYRSDRSFSPWASFCSYQGSAVSRLQYVGLYPS